MDCCLIPQSPIEGFGSPHIMRQCHRAPPSPALPHASSVIRYMHLSFHFPPSYRSSFPKLGHLSLSRANQSPSQSLADPPAHRSVAGGTQEPGPLQTSRPERSKQGPNERRQQQQLWRQQQALSREPWGAQERVERLGPWHTSKSRQRRSSLQSIKPEPTSSRPLKSPGCLLSAQRKDPQA